MESYGLRISLVLLVTVGFNRSVPSPTPSPEPSGDVDRCIVSCGSVQAGRWYHKCGTRCGTAIFCGQRKAQQIDCSKNRQWDNKRERCVSAPSPTCSLQANQMTTEASSSTSTWSSTNINTEPQVQTEVSREVDSNSQFESSQNGNTPGRQPTNRKDPPPPPTPSCDPLLEVIPCRYVLVLSAIVGVVIPLVIYLTCQLCKNKRKLKLKRFTATHYVSVAIQTSPSYEILQTDIDNDSAIYDDLVPSRANHLYKDKTSADTYTPLPYAVSGETTSYKEIEMPNSTGNEYLEILGYSYLQLQDVETRKEVSQTLAPLIVELCKQYKSNPVDYRAVVNTKLGKCLKTDQ